MYSEMRSKHKIKLRREDRTKSVVRHLRRPVNIVEFPFLSECRVESVRKRATHLRGYPQHAHTRARMLNPFPRWNLNGELLFLCTTDAS